jgi:hypothetical protein
METQTTQPVVTTGCCPPFNPAIWQDREIVWTDKKFIKGTVRSFLHMPLNMGSVITHLCSIIDKAGASMDQETIILSDEVSGWRSDQYIAVSKIVPGCNNVTLSGTFLIKVFEGPYRLAPKWYQEMEQYVASKGKTAKKIYAYYTSCPKCAKTYGKNYVVLFAQV